MTAAWAHFLILDDAPDDAARIDEWLKSLFGRVNLKISTTILTGPDHVKKALDAHPDYFICDIRLSDVGEVAGLELIENYKPKFPHINFIAITMEFEKLKDIGHLAVQPDLILSKLMTLSLQSEPFDKYMLGYFVVNRRQNRGLEISRESEVERISKKALGWHHFDGPLFDCLVRQVFKGFDLQLSASQFALMDDIRPRTAFLGEIVDYVKIRSMERQGQSGSAVFKAAPKYKRRPYQVTLVLKFCRMNDFLKEISNYSRYVKWMLPYSWRVDVLGEGISANVGVIAYSLAFAGSADAQPLSQYTIAANSSPVLSFINQVFSPINRTWYAAIDAATGKNLAHELLSRYFAGDQGRFIKHVASIEKILNNSELFFQIYPGKRSEVFAAFVERVRRLVIVNPTLANFETCICHGDLHCDNIMVGERVVENEGPKKLSWQFTFIDFQDAGPAHVGTDFVVFENSIRKDSGFTLGNMSPVEYYNSERELILSILTSRPNTESSEDTSDLLALVKAIRAAFFANFEHANREHFVFHLFVFTLFMIDEGFHNLRRKEILLAFFCAVVDALSEFRREGGNGNNVRITKLSSA